MKVTQLLVRLYPVPLRDRWGDGIADEADVGGWRRLPDLVAGLLDMWLHPVVWPADSGAQRRRRAAALTFVLGVTGWLVGHVAAEVSLLPGSVTHSWAASGSDVLTLAALVAVVPRPRLSRRAVLVLSGQLARKLAVPVALGAVIVLRANLGDAVSPELRVALVTGWWLVLVLGAGQVCHMVAALDPGMLVPPHPLRLRLGIAALALALAFSGGIVLLAGLEIGASVLSSAVGGILLVLTALCGGTLRDLSAIRAQRGDPRNAR